MFSRIESIRQRLVEFAVISLAFIFAAVSFLAVNLLVDASDQVKSSHEVLSRISEIEKLSITLETARRGYMLTHHSDYISEIELSQEVLLVVIREARGLIQSDTEQVARLNRLEDLVRRAWNQSLLAKIQAPPLQEKRVPTDDTARFAGNAIIAQIDAEITAFHTTEANRLVLREQNWETQSNLTSAIVTIATLLLIGFAGFQMHTTKNLRRETAELEEERTKMEGRNWVKSNLATLSRNLQNIKSPEMFAATIMNKLVPLLDGHVGIFYGEQKEKDDRSTLMMLGTYAFQEPEGFSPCVEFGQGLIGQCALEGKTILLEDLKDSPVNISFATGKVTPQSLVIFPLMFEHKLFAVIEIGSAHKFSPDHMELIEEISNSFGVILSNMSVRLQTVNLLKESRAQSEELEIQQDGLKTANEVLAKQTERLKLSEEELRVLNEELVEKQEALRLQNEAVAEAHQDAENKADQLADASKYKSEFLANMSHELRTPLNSLLILSKMLADNAEGNLTTEQVEDAQIIHDGGRDLLELINDIMDLSKVEAGMLEIQLEDFSLDDLERSMKSLFNSVAEHNKLDFIINREAQLPRTIHSDGQRIEQIIKNFLSNSFKFTDAGSVTLSIHRPHSHVNLANSSLRKDDMIGFSVSDTGIGIASEKLQDIFDAFRQEDGSTSRKYGGTGLGLSISQNLSTLLGGEIFVESEKGQGSTFTLYLPVGSESASPARDETQDLQHEKGPARPIANSVSSPHPTQKKPLNSKAGEATIIIVEDDLIFANIMKNTAIKAGYTPIMATEGREALYLAIENQPQGILLDIGLPDMDGMHVLEQLQAHKATRDIPVHVVSAGDFEQETLQQGAMSFLQKPPSQKQLSDLFATIKPPIGKNKAILLVEDDAVHRGVIKRLVEASDTDVTSVASGNEACEKIKAEHFDCVILDLGLPDISGYEVLDQIKELDEESRPPVIIYTGQDISNAEHDTLSQYASDIIIKGPQSEERLQDDIALFLHSVHDDQDAASIAPEGVDDADVLQGRSILVVDDDMRNVFALSRQLGALGLDVTIAENGQLAIDSLDEAMSDPDQLAIELVLMDIMMPVMDGHEAMEKIRAKDQYGSLPIIALTANAMPEDRAKCIQSGASDYLAKPLDMDRLIAMLRVWLYRPYV